MQAKLYSGVNFTSEDTVLFATKVAQTIYFNNKVAAIIDVAEKVIAYSVKVPHTTMSYYELQEISYVSTTKTIHGKTKTYYYRVLDIVALNDNTSELILELDILQTYMFDYEIEDAAINRQHEDRWTQDGERIISTTPEPIDSTKDLIRIFDFDYINEFQFYENSRKKYKLYTALLMAEPTDTGNDGYKRTQTSMGSFVQPLDIYTTFLLYDVEAKMFVEGEVDNKDKPKVRLVVGGNSHPTGDISHVLKFLQRPEAIKVVILPHAFGVLGDFDKTTTGNVPTWHFEVHLPSSTEFKDGAFDGSILKTVNIKEDGFYTNNYFSLKLNAVTWYNNNVLSRSKRESKIYAPQYTSLHLGPRYGDKKVMTFDEFTTIEPVVALWSLGADFDIHSMLDIQSYENLNNVFVYDNVIEITRINNDYITYMTVNKEARKAQIKQERVDKFTSVVNTAISAWSFATQMQTPKNPHYDEEIVAYEEKMQARLKKEQWDKVARMKFPEEYQSRNHHGMLMTGSALANSGSQLVSAWMAPMHRKAKEKDLKNKAVVNDHSVVNNRDLTYQTGGNRDVLMITHPDPVNEARLTEFFNRYGYTSHKFGKPNLKSRQLFNYIQAVNINYSGDIPFNVRRQLDVLYANGVRFWHIPAAFLRYDLDNKEIFLV